MFRFVENNKNDLYVVSLLSYNYIFVFLNILYNLHKSKKFVTIILSRYLHKISAYTIVFYCYLLRSKTVVRATMFRIEPYTS